MGTVELRNILYTECRQNACEAKYGETYTKDIGQFEADFQAQAKLDAEQQLLEQGRAAEAAAEEKRQKDDAEAEKAERKRKAKEAKTKAKTERQERERKAKEVKAKAKTERQERERKAKEVKANAKKERQERERKQKATEKKEREELKRQRKIQESERWGSCKCGKNCGGSKCGTAYVDRRRLQESPLVHRLRRERRRAQMRL